MEISAANTQRLAGRIAGFTLLLLIASGLIGIALQQGIVVDGNPAQSAANILVHGLRFRAGILLNIVMFNCDVVLAIALYALLRPMGPALALLGAFWRIANATVLATGAAATLLSVRMLTDGPPFGTAQQASHLLRSYEGSASTLGLMFFCLGAGIHSYLLFKSRYIPRILSGLYLAVSAQLFLGCCLFILEPSWTWTLGVAALLPDLFVELSVALWLAIKGVRIPEEFLANQSRADSSFRSE